MATANITETVVNLASEAVVMVQQLRDSLAKPSSFVRRYQGRCLRR